MIVLRLGSSMSRGLAVALPVAILAAPLLSVVIPLLVWRHSLQADVLDVTESVKYLRATIKRSNARTNSALLNVDSATLGGDFLQGADVPLIIADLQTRLRALVVSENAELDSARALPHKVIEQQSYVGARLQIRGSFRGIHAIIFAIEDATPFLFLERVQIRMEDRRAAVGEVLGEAAVMFADLDVYGAQWPAAEFTSGGGAK